jgi:3-hydroxyacyl-[acyl-carrier-protein] dehydratase
MDREEIKQILPHREPFLFLDEIEEIVPGKTAKGYFIADERFDFFRGHFPGNPVLPGVIMVEASAQLGACAVLMLEEFKGKTAYFAGIEEFKFKRIVRPGEKLQISVELLSLRRNYGKGKVSGSVSGEAAFEGIISFVVK